MIGPTVGPTQDHPFGATNQPDTCLWCGRKLKAQYEEAGREYHRVPDSVMIRKQPDGSKVSSCCKAPLTYKPVPTGETLHGHPLVGTDINCSQCGSRCDKLITKVTHGKLLGLGGYFDGFFCGLRCAYWFAVILASAGRRLKPEDTK